MAAVITAQSLGFEEIYVPALNAAEGSVIKGIKVYGVKTLRHLIRHLSGEEPMTPEEAVLQMNMLSHDFFAFCDEDGIPFIVYKRKKGDYGLIEITSEE